MENSNDRKLIADFEEQVAHYSDVVTLKIDNVYDAHSDECDFVVHPEIGSINVPGFTFTFDEDNMHWFATYDKSGLSLEVHWVYINHLDYSIANGFELSNDFVRCISKQEEDIQEVCSKLRNFNSYKKYLSRIKSAVESKIDNISLDVETCNENPANVPAADFQLYINGNLYRDGRGRSIFPLTESIYDTDIAFIVKTVSRYVNKYKKNPVTMRSMREMYSIAPNEIKSIASSYRWWICNEKCGGANTLDDALEYVLKRTFNNSRCWFHNDEKTPQDLNILFNYAKENNLSVSDFIKFCRG